MKDWEVWIMIPALMLFTLTFFIAFEDFKIDNWLIINGYVSLGIGFIYIGENIHKRFKE